MYPETNFGNSDLNARVGHYDVGKRYAKQGGIGSEFVTFEVKIHIFLRIFAVPTCYKVPIFDPKTTLRRAETYFLAGRPWLKIWWFSDQISH